MKIIPVAEAKAKLSEYIEKSEEELVVITKNGRPCPVLMSITDEDDLERLALSRNRRLREILAQSKKSVMEGKGIAHDEFWASVNQK